MTVTENEKRLVIVGATGMVGSDALRYALDHPAVAAATAIGRKPTGRDAYDGPRDGGHTSTS